MTAMPMTISENTQKLMNFRGFSGCPKSTVSDDRDFEFGRFLDEGLYSMEGRRSELFGSSRSPTLSSASIGK